jgi:hypothetical protein
VRNGCNWVKMQYSSKTISQDEIVTQEPLPLAGKGLRILALALAGVAIVSSAFHFWPFEDSKAWQMLCPTNLAVVIWVLIFSSFFLRKRNNSKYTSLLPHVSILAYLTVNVLSIAFATNPARAVNYTAKLALMLGGGYVLLSSAIWNMKTLRTIYTIAIVAIIISVSYCLVSRIVFGSEDYGFHGSAYKYGTYVGALVPLCSVYLIASPRSTIKLFGAIVAIAGFLSCGSFGGIVAIVMGISVAAVVYPSWIIRFSLVAVLIISVTSVFLLSSTPSEAFLKNDLKLAENDGVNLRQRYIEWQAEINLLEKRTATGTGAGCINDYRSAFYYRLPKLNTIKPFDQNGYLTTAAETGILGLACFCWIITVYVKSAVDQVTRGRRSKSYPDIRLATANLAAFVAVCTANLFSSVHYNGILIVFVLVIVLIWRTETVVNKRRFLDETIA